MKPVDRMIYQTTCLNITPLTLCFPRNKIYLNISFHLQVSKENRKRIRRKRIRRKREDGSDKATQSCSHGFSLRWQKLLGNPVCSGVNTSSDDKIPFKASFSLSHDNVLPHICTTICLAHYKRFNLKQCCVLFLLERVNLWTRMTPRLRRLSTRISRLETR